MSSTGDINIILADIATTTDENKQGFEVHDCTYVCKNLN